MIDKNGLKILVGVGTLIFSFLYSLKVHADMLDISKFKPVSYCLQITNTNNFGQYKITAHGVQTGLYEGEKDKIVEVTGSECISFDKFIGEIRLTAVNTFTGETVNGNLSIIPVSILRNPDYRDRITDVVEIKELNTKTGVFNIIPLYVSYNDSGNYQYTNVTNTISESNRPKIKSLVVKDLPFLVVIGLLATIIFELALYKHLLKIDWKYATRITTVLNIATYPAAVLCYYLLHSNLFFTEAAVVVVETLILYKKYKYTAPKAGFAAVSANFASFVLGNLLLAVYLHRFRLTI